MAVFRLVLIPLIIGGAAAQVELKPQNLAVLLGSQALFNCSTTSAQPAMIWSLNGIFAVSIQMGNVVPLDPRFSAKTYNISGIFNTELNISEVKRSDTGEVSCQFLGGPFGVSRLSVQERGSVAITGGNRTVIQGSQTEFQCQALGWSPEPNMSWTVNGVVVKNCTNSSVAQGNVFNTICTLPVTAAINSSVQCLVKVSSMSSPEISTVFLSVVYLRGSVAIIGGNRTVIQGVQTEFQCQAFAWSPEPNVSWSVNGVVVKNCTNSSVAQGNVFNTICTLPVTATINSSVQCLVKVSSMSSPDISTIFLTVGPKPRDYTILIAVTVAFSAAALLFLLIFGIFFFCRRRKKEKSGYEEEVRRAQLQSQHMATITSDARGRDNRGYVTDGRYGGNHNGAVWNTDYSPKPQRSYPKDDFFDDGYKNHRHMTMV
ncbi:immunoglobulin superfamily member 5 isoform X1 [Triplophysa dalaica]|uniref:immunoglobulin superfamily member 5 isoform X1 n=1 Tax=Triplophysa dalaica TaxID=1582913 RepID=UPI0024E036EA|nr:immunoglobulin superfamily member 5 isoform X1 [Triplophysa dalaica]